MKTIDTQIVQRTYQSEIHPEIIGHNTDDGDHIAYADNLPVVWKIVMGTKSSAFGKNSGHQLGSMRGSNSSGAVIARIEMFRDYLNKPGFWGWRAAFTLEHYEDKDFKSGFFHQFDGTYDRGCCYLDYTTSALEECIEQFLAWCDSSYKFPTAALDIDKKRVRTYNPPR
jgi:hypothetical protein